MLCHRSKAMEFRAVAAGAASCLLLLALGCGSRGTNSSSGAGSRAAESGRFELDVAHCGGFGPAEAAAILGVPAEKFHDKSQNLSDHSRWCLLANHDDPEKGVTFTIGRAKSVEDAAAEFEQFRQHVGVAVGAIGKPGQQAHEIPGLGDEALWTPVPGGVYVRKGRYNVQVNEPADEETQIKIARKILGE